MKFCPNHWQAVVDAVDARGLADVSHVTIDTSAAGLLAQLQDTTTPSDLRTFDGLGDTVTQVLTSLGTVDLNADGCPVCNATTKTDVTKIEQAADQLLAVYDDLTTSELHRQMAGLFGGVGVTTAQAQLDYAAQVVGAPVESLDGGLTADEISAVIEALRGDLQAQQDGPAPKIPAKEPKGGAR